MVIVRYERPLGQRGPFYYGKTFDNYVQGSMLLLSLRCDIVETLITLNERLYLGTGLQVVVSLSACRPFPAYNTMVPTGGSVTYERDDGGTEERMLFEYSQEEQQQNKINAAHADLLLGIRYINVPIQMIQEGFDLVEATLFGHIYNLLTSAKKRYYFTNTQLATLLGVSERKISDAVKKLCDSELIESSVKLRSGGGKIRFITLNSRLAEFASPTRTICASNSQEVRSHIITKRKVLKDNKVDGNKIALFSPSDKEYKYAQRFFERLQEINPTIKKPNLSRWAADFDLLLRVDKRDEQQLGKVVSYALTGFWRGKIMSPKKLREKYDTLTTQMLTDTDKQGKPTAAGLAASDTELEVRTTFTGREYVVTKDTPKSFIPPEYMQKFRLMPSEWQKKTDDGSLFFFLKDWYKKNGKGTTDFEIKYCNTPTHD